MFHYQAYVFLQCDKTKKAITHGLIYEQFHGDDEKRIVGACQQLVDGHNAFAFLYNVSEGESGPEYTFKSFFCGNDTSTNYVAGVHVTVEMIATKCNKLLSGHMLWRAGESVLRSVKKAMAIVPKLDGMVVHLGKNHQVLGYASGKKLETFIQFIHNGMYTLTLKEVGKAPTGNNDDESDNDNEVLGEVVCKTPIGKPLCLVDDDGIVETKMGDNNDDEVEEVVTVNLASWNPFNSVKALEGYCFFGKFAFLCYGPASEYFSETLSSKGSQVTSCNVEGDIHSSRCESRCRWE